eukprot:CAMPEP_0197600548 /NCGR_PEP_ID=MMETSP1326-20131121/33468_1 /TAXON_ID=1155430 /ORGANISM="Genus nov. species nov., Strain RCC2288" /LENGTH=69 /DNA_ID=CAMNT_0043167657 /DNA_START=108 /DNA_END=313 /DNA_ORIENTATION=+
MDFSDCEENEDEDTHDADYVVGEDATQRPTPHRAMHKRNAHDAAAAAASSAAPGRRFLHARGGGGGGGG